MNSMASRFSERSSGLILLSLMSAAMFLAIQSSPKEQPALAAPPIDRTSIEWPDRALQIDVEELFVAWMEPIRVENSRILARVVLRYSPIDAAERRIIYLNDGDLPWRTSWQVIKGIPQQFQVTIHWCVFPVFGEWHALLPGDEISGEFDLTPYLQRGLANDRGAVAMIDESIVLSIPVRIRWAPMTREFDYHTHEARLWTQLIAFAEIPHGDGGPTDR